MLLQCWNEFKSTKRLAGRNKVLILDKTLKKVFGNLWPALSWTGFRNPSWSVTSTKMDGGDSSDASAVHTLTSHILLDSFIKRNPFQVQFFWSTLSLPYMFWHCSASSSDDIPFEQRRDRETMAGTTLKIRLSWAFQTSKAFVSVEVIWHFAKTRILSKQEQFRRAFTQQLR